jgi:signal transduction histidine kinase
VRRAKPALTIRARLTLTYAALFTLGGGALVLAMTTAFYHFIFQPLPAGAVPSSLDPDHDHFVGLSDQIRDAAASRLLQIALLLLLLVVATSALVGWWVAGRMLRPIAAITAAARSATDTTLHERLNLPGPPDELKQLGDTFDQMLERLDAAFAAQRRFVANASHELRTPLALTRAAVEVTLAKPEPDDQQWRTMAADVAESTRSAQNLIEALLVLARSEQGITDPQPDDLADLAAEAMDQIAVRSRGRGLRLRTELGPAPLNGNVALLGIAVANLLENAVRYNRDGGLLEVVSRQNGVRWVELVVSNDGPEVPPELLQQLFEPFHRGRDSRRSGSGGSEGVGLGLSIVRAVARAHGGEVTARPRPEGGLAVTLRLPVVVSAASAGAA